MAATSARQPKGIPAGGQFAATPHNESAVVLTAPPAPDFPELTAYGEIPAPVEGQTLADGPPAAATFEGSHSGFFRPLDEYEAANGPFESSGPVSEGELLGLTGLKGVDLGRKRDPHHEPRGRHPGVSMLYAATDPTTAFGEVFQSRRSIAVSGLRGIAGWPPIRELRLLDLTSGSWALRNGASASLDSAPKSTCRGWARAITGTWTDLDGLYVRSTMTGLPMVVLYAPAVSSFPANPAFARPLDHPVLAPLITRATDGLQLVRAAPPVAH